MSFCRTAALLALVNCISFSPTKQKRIGIEGLPDDGVAAVLGAKCDNGFGCQSGFCFDGVCCDTACGGQCQGCAEPGYEPGSCVTVSGAPRGKREACTGTGTGTGTECVGSCDGLNPIVCAYPPAGRLCGAACDGQCDGQGICGTGLGACAGGFGCDAGGCKTSCSSTSDCQPHFQCVAPQCVRDDEADCLDGADDNGDGLVDCQDPTCNQLVECVALPGLTDQLGTLATGPCELEFGPSESVHHGLNAPATCDGCACTTRMECYWHITLAPLSDCTGTGSNSLALEFPSDNSEFPFSGPPGPPAGNRRCVADYGAPKDTAGTAHYYKFGAAMLPSGPPYTSTAAGFNVCDTVTSAVPTAATWSDTREFCPVNRSSMSCALGQACVAKTTKPLCVRRAGAGSTCPSGFATSASDWFTGVNEGRTCGSCPGCSLTSNGVCNNLDGRVDLWTSAGGCSDPFVQLDVLTTNGPPGGGACTDIGGLSDFRSLWTDTQYDAGGTCSQPQPAGAGAASGAGASTLCCR